MTAQRARPTDTNHLVPFAGALANGHLGQLMLPGAEAFFAAMAASQREMLDFVSRRAEKNGEVLRELTACQNWTDALSVQSRWMQEMMQDCTAETTKLLALSTTAGRQAGAAQEGR
jgi:Phasin protein